MIIDPATDGGLICVFSVNTETPKFETYSYKQVDINTIGPDGYITFIYDETERARQVRRRLGNEHIY